MLVSAAGVGQRTAHAISLGAVIPLALAAAITYGAADEVRLETGSALFVGRRPHGAVEQPPRADARMGIGDRRGRKPLIVAGMLVQAAALGLLATGGGTVATAAAAAALLGAGTALVYPTLIAAISDAVRPVARAPVVGVYRFWRDMAYAFGGLIAGLTADALGYGGAIALVARMTAASGLWVLRDMPGDRRDRHSSQDPPHAGSVEALGKRAPAREALRSYGP